ncbi:MAG: methionyl-tRNA formyltransferase [Anaerolineales bacterium]|jgi:methionyl-tRNA formyltransferase
MHVVFMGSPSFALPTLRALATEYDVSGVVTMPDRPAGRGRQLSPPPVKELALQLGLPLLQPVSLKDEAVVSQLRAWEPALVVVAAYGQILPREVLNLPRLGCLNLHASLLPRYRGASPISAAILAGDRVTGVTLMKMDAGMDSGPILAQEVVEILPEEDAGSLRDRLAELASAMVSRYLPPYLRAQLAPADQDPSRVSYAPLLHKEDGRLDFRDTALSLDRRIRAVSPWPGAYCYWDKRRLRIIRARSIASQADSALAAPGMVFETPSGPAARTGAGDLLLLQIQLPGRKVLQAVDFARGARGFLGSKLQ